MFRRLLPQTSVLTFELVLLVTFFACFIVMLLWVYRRSGKKVYDVAARLPLEDER